jgi:hypothetical protein
MAKLPSSFPLVTRFKDQGLLTSLQQMYQRVAGVFNNPDFGATTARPPQNLTVGQTFFDTTLGTPIWWNGTGWVDSTGGSV